MPPKADREFLRKKERMWLQGLIKNPNPSRVRQFKTRINQTFYAAINDLMLLKHNEIYPLDPKLILEQVFSQPAILAEREFATMIKDSKPHWIKPRKYGDGVTLECRKYPKKDLIDMEITSPIDMPVGGEPVYKMNIAIPAERLIIKVIDIRGKEHYHDLVCFYAPSSWETASNIKSRRDEVNKRDVEQIKQEIKPHRISSVRTWLIDNGIINPERFQIQSKYPQ